MTKRARKLLAAVLRASVPTQKINAGVVDLFHRMGLTETVDLRSPFAIHTGGPCKHEQITGAGRASLASK